MTAKKDTTRTQISWVPPLQGVISCVSPRFEAYDEPYICKYLAFMSQTLEVVEECDLGWIALSLTGGKSTGRIL